MTNNLPTLTGSDKQIAWATDIRSKALANLDEWWLTMKLPTFAEISRTAAQARYEGFVAKLVARTDSKFWIDNQEINHYVVFGAAERWLKLASSL